MIVRLWTARAAQSDVAKYLRHFRTSVEPGLVALPGFLGAEVLVGAMDAGEGHASSAAKRTEGREEEVVELVVATRWASMDAVRGFAGPTPYLAVVDPAAAAVLESYDRLVRHFTLALATTTHAPAATTES